MTYLRGMKPSRKQQALQKTLQLVQSLKKLEESGALRINAETREVHLVKELFWDGKDLAWKKNFTANLYLLMERHLEKHTGQPFHLFSINLDTKEKGEYITSYLPDLKACKDILEI